MLIKDIGGEFTLIQRLNSIIPNKDKNVLVGIGDDAAVIELENDKKNLLLVTTDTLVSGDHFNTSWSKPEQIGLKSVECNVSDIAAMGGMPTHMFISLVLTPKTTVEWVEEIYKGMASSCKRHNVVVIGGDTTHGPVETISITLHGLVSRQNLCLRSQAKAGDILIVTGQLGASTACLNLLRKNKQATPFLLEKHLTPKCRLDVSQKIAPFVNAMIDVSDGLASETNHICSQSNVGAKIFLEKIPMHADSIEAGKQLDIDPVEFALNGGEDFELLFTIDPANLKKLENLGIEFFVVGEIVDKSEGCILIDESNKKLALRGGYNHFE